MFFVFNSVEKNSKIRTTREAATQNTHSEYSPGLQTILPKPEPMSVSRILNPAK